MPSEFWQLPAIAVIAVLVIGYLLVERRQMAKERRAELTALVNEHHLEQKEGAEERQKYITYIQEMLEDEKAERKASRKQLQTLIEQATTVQQQTASAIAALTETLCGEMERHEARAENRFEQQDQRACERNEALLKEISLFLRSGKK